MKRYEPSTPKAALGALGAIMAAATMAVMVFAPAGLEAGDADAATLSRVTPRSLIRMAIAVVATEAVSAGRRAPTPTHHSIGGKS